MVRETLMAGSFVISSLNKIFDRPTGSFKLLVIGFAQQIKKRSVSGRFGRPTWYENQKFFRRRKLA